MLSCDIRATITEGVSNFNLFIRFTRTFGACVVLVVHGVCGVRSTFSALFAHRWNQPEQQRSGKKCGVRFGVYLHTATLLWRKGVCFAFSRWHSGSAQFPKWYLWHPRSCLRIVLKFIFVGMHFYISCAFCGVISNYCDHLWYWQPCWDKKQSRFIFNSKWQVNSQEKSGGRVYYVSGFITWVNAVHASKASTFATVYNPYEVSGLFSTHICCHLMGSSLPVETWNTLPVAAL